MRGTTIRSASPATRAAVQIESGPPLRDLVLVGGGHSHVQVLRSLGMAPLPATRVTLLAREAHTPYSGMLPGLVAGRYQWDDIHIDLAPLCRFAGARLIVGEATGLDLARNLLQCAGRPAIRFDLLSINCGAAPEALGAAATQGATDAEASKAATRSRLPFSAAATRGAADAEASKAVTRSRLPSGAAATQGGSDAEALAAAGVPVKPIGRFLPHWQAALQGARPGARFLFVGGGAGGVELALAARRALPRGVRIELVAEQLLPGQGAWAKRRIAQELAKAGIALHRATAVASEDGLLSLDDGATLEFDQLFWATGVVAPPWVAGSALATDARGFVKVDAALRSISHPQVFAAGDIASLQGQPRPKSGVIAVRAGPVLDANLRRALDGQPLRRFRAQKRFLSLIAAGDGRALAFWFGLALGGRWAWRWKDWIDRRFMAKFQLREDAPRMQEAFDPMRCGGCGAKLAADPLRRALARLPAQQGPNLLQGIGDDAAVLRSEPGPLVLSVDGFRSLVDDPYLFGRIAAHHALNDIYAMGARPTSALALATVPLMAEAMMEDELCQLLKGAVDALNADGVPLAGGHSSEGAELSLGIAATGTADGPLLTKSGCRPGDRLLLTKPLGSGVLLAAHMRGLAPSRALPAALASMDQSNRAALQAFRAHHARAATDVTGFGLAGHLGEMLQASGTGAWLWLRRLPALPGALESFRRGAASVLQAANERALADWELRGCAATDPQVRLLADPQTAGGLLACVPESKAASCLQALLDAGYAASVEIGMITEEGRRLSA